VPEDKTQDSVILLRRDGSEYGISPKMQKAAVRKSMLRQFNRWNAIKAYKKQQLMKLNGLV